MRFLQFYLAISYSLFSGLPVFLNIANLSIYTETDKSSPLVHGSLLPISLLFLLLLSFSSLVPALAHIRLSRKLFLGLLCALLLLFLHIIQYDSFVQSLQLVVALIVFFSIPSVLRLFSFRLYAAGVFAIAFFSFIHFSSLLSNSTLLSGYSAADYFNGYRIHGAFVTYPDVLISFAATSLLPLCLGGRRFGQVFKLQFAFISFFLIIYSFIFSRATTLIAVLLSPLIFLLLNISAISRFASSLRISKNWLLLPFLIYLGFQASMQLSLAEPIINQFINRLFIEGGSNRLDIWSSLVSAVVLNPTGLLFGGQQAGAAHNYFLDLLLQVGIVGIIVFFLSLYLSVRNIYRKLGLNQVVLRPLRTSYAFALFLSNLLSGNLANQSFGNPYCLSAIFFFVLSCLLYATSSTEPLKNTISIS